MKKTLWIMAAIAAAAAAAWFLFFRAGAPLAKKPTVATTGSATTPPAWWPTTLTAQNLTATTGFVTSAFDSLKNLSNAFGFNDGGRSSVSVGGSAAGGAQSSGSGAGVPTDGFGDYYEN